MQEDKIELGVEEVHEPLEIPIDMNRAGSNPLSSKSKSKVILSLSKFILILSNYSRSLERLFIIFIYF